MVVAVAVDSAVAAACLGPGVALEAEWPGPGAGWRDPAVECHDPVVECHDRLAGCHGRAAECHVRVVVYRVPAAECRGPVEECHVPAADRGRRSAVPPRSVARAAVARDPVAARAPGPRCNPGAALTSRRGRVPRLGPQPELAQDRESVRERVSDLVRGSRSDQPGCRDWVKVALDRACPIKVREFRTGWRTVRNHCRIVRPA